MKKYEIKDFRRQTLKLGDIVYRADGGSRGHAGYFGVVNSIKDQKFSVIECTYSVAPEIYVRVDKHYFYKNGKRPKPKYVDTLNKTGGDMIIINDLQTSDKEYHARAIKLRHEILKVVKVNNLEER